MLTTSSSLLSPLDLSGHGISNEQVWIKREDLLHPLYGGNKFRKLHYNLLKAKQLGQDTVLTFGGPWSNHIYSTAAACKELGLQSIGIIRGEVPKNPSDTLQFASACGMKLIHISRAEYKEKHEPFFKAWLRDKLGSFYLIPEGGSNYLGVQGCVEILDEQTRHFPSVVSAMGTGATASGLLLGSRPEQRIIGIPVIGEGEGLRSEVQRFLYEALMDQTAVEDELSRFDLKPDFHRKGYGQWDQEELDFMRAFHRNQGIELDHVYTAKAMMALIALLKSGEITGPVLFIHTGGQQGNKGLERELGESVFD